MRQMSICSCCENISDFMYFIWLSLIPLIIHVSIWREKAYTQINVECVCSEKRRKHNNEQFQMEKFLFSFSGASRLNGGCLKITNIHSGCIISTVSNFFLLPKINIHLDRLWHFTALQIQTYNHYNHVCMSFRKADKILPEIFDRRNLLKMQMLGAFFSCARVCVCVCVCAKHVWVNWQNHRLTMFSRICIFQWVFKLQPLNVEYNC